MNTAQLAVWAALVAYALTLVSIGLVSGAMTSGQAAAAATTITAAGTVLLMALMDDD